MISCNDKLRTKRELKASREEKTTLLNNVPGLTNVVLYIKYDDNHSTVIFNIGKSEERQEKKDGWQTPNQEIPDRFV